MSFCESIIMTIYNKEETMQKRQFLMQMGKNQPLKAYSSCKTCGGEQQQGAGYICGSDAEGNGFVIWIEEEEVFQTLEKVFQEQVPSTE
jgi:hypothetical protein